MASLASPLQQYVWQLPVSPPTEEHNSCQKVPWLAPCHGVFLFLFLLNFERLGM